MSAPNTTTTKDGKSIKDLREVLFATLEAVKTGAMDLDKARQVNEIAKTIVETAKVEVDYLRVAGGAESAFLEPKEPPQPTPLPDGAVSSVFHLAQR